MTHNLRVAKFERLDSPDAIKKEIPISKSVEQLVNTGRQAMRAALQGKDQRLVVIIGPCSIHDPQAALEYGKNLAKLSKKIADKIFIIMRVYFEKPRTVIGWKGLINDPHLDESFDINQGLRIARKLLVVINELGLPCATEFLDPIVPQYTADLVSWTAIGARTTESQTHREMASGLSMPVGFKNSTDGDLTVAVNAMISARHPHAFLGIDQSGQTAIVKTSGNQDTHIVLRGGNDRPNYSKADMAYAKVTLEPFAGERLIMVDCSHGNSNKDYTRQPKVFNELLEQFLEDQKTILGMMLESNLKEGRQDLKSNLEYGKSITDGCISWAATEELLLNAYKKLR